MYRYAPFVVVIGDVWFGGCPGTAGHKLGALALRRQTRVDRCDRLVKTERFDVAVEFAQWIETFGCTATGILDEIIESIFASDYNKVGDAVAEPDAHNDRISVGEIGVDERIGRQVFVNMADAIGREPSGAVPIDPTALGIAADSAQKPV